MPFVTIYHNPGCRTSRNTLALIAQMGVPVWGVMRAKEDGEPVVNAQGERIAPR